MFFPHDTPPFFRILAVGIGLLGIVSFVRCASSVVAQDVEPVDEPVVVERVAVMLARSCVSERSWRVESSDCAAIAAVVQTRVSIRGGTFEDSLRALAPRLHGGTTTRRRWLLDLDADAHRPEGFPVRWNGRNRDAWIATMFEAQAHLEAIRDDNFASPCASPPRAWGSHADVARRRERGFRFVEIECGDTHNMFGRLYSPRSIRGELALDGAHASR